MAPNPRSAASCALPLAMAALACVIALALRPASATEPVASAREMALRVDARLDARLQADRIPIAPPADDATFLRRVYLDVLGTIPTAEDVRRFLGAGEPGKRARVIDDLLASESHPRYWATWWYRTLTGMSVSASGVDGDDGARILIGTSGARFQQWLEDQVRANRPFDAVAVDLLTASGRTDRSGAAAYIARYGGEPNAMVTAVARHFLGLRIACARCHDHPYQDWTQDDFRGLAAFFGRTRAVRVASERMADAAGAGRVRTLAMFEYVARIEDFADDLLDESAPTMMLHQDLKDESPRLWQGETIPVAPGSSRRAQIAHWITSPTNPRFAQAVVNRVWGALLGHGFVEPVDDLDAQGDGSHPEVLRLLATDFVASGHDLRRLFRIVLNTQAYQRGPGRRTPDTQVFAVAAVRPLSVDQLALAVVRAIELDQVEPPETRFGQLLREELSRELAQAFDPDEDVDTPDAGNLPAALYLMNDRTLARLLSGRRRTSVRALRKRFASDRARITHLYLTVYGREPSAAECQQAQQFVHQAPKDEAYGDLLWALVNSAEFVTNH